MTKQAAANEQWKAFLEKTPANTPVKITGLVDYGFQRGVSSRYHFIHGIRLDLHCQVDGGSRGFSCSEEEVMLHSAASFVLVEYTCRDCGNSTKTFALLVERSSEDSEDVEAMKLGEYPPFAPPISKRVAKLLGKHDLEIYRKGYRAEAQGLGVGAASYFRRVVENQWHLLVTEIRDAAAQLGIKNLAVFDAALAETQFSKAVEMLKDAIPSKLLILDGQNPLTLLYQPLSVGIHDLSDEECLQQAADIRTVLNALLENIADVLKDQEGLKSAASRLSQRKTTP